MLDFDLAELCEVQTRALIQAVNRNTWLLEPESCTFYFFRVMNKHIDKGELVIYQAADSADFQIEVRVKDDTVWLNRHQIAQLFERDIKTIGKHIANAVKEELHSLPVVANFATTASDGKSYQVEHYNLDMIISIGYRVKSLRGVQSLKLKNEN
jgi:hypothetical protein